jgi:hypothetical protein
MSHAFTVFVFTFGLFLGMLLFLEIGRRIAVRRMREDSGTAGEGVGAVDGAVFALLGLLIAFTFSGASSRFDTRRQLIVEETNDIGTAYLRLDLLPADLQPALRENFRRYLDARIEVYWNCRTLRPPKSLWQRPTSCRNKFGARRLLPAGRKALRLQRRYYCSLR